MAKRSRNPYVGPDLGDERFCMYPCGCVGVFHRTNSGIELRAYVYQCGELGLMQYPNCVHSCMEAIFLNEQLGEAIRWQ